MLISTGNHALSESSEAGGELAIEDGLVIITLLIGESGYSFFLGNIDMGLGDDSL